MTQMKKMKILLKKISNELKKLFYDLYKNIISAFKNDKVDIDAVNEIINKTDFFVKQENIVKNGLLSGAKIGLFGKATEYINTNIKGQILTKLLYHPYNGQNLNLSQRLHNLTINQYNIIKNTVQQQITTGKTVRELATKLYDGYGYGNEINRTTLPKYMQELILAYRKNSNNFTNTKEYEKAVKNILKLKTTNLKTAYKEILDITNKSLNKNMEKAISVAINEKSRYLANRIARTEIIRAEIDGFLAKTINDNAVVAYKLMTGSNHPQNDICDEYVNKDVWGMGKGIYHKHMIPKVPLHPHCRCLLSEVFADEIKYTKNRDIALQRQCVPTKSRLENII